MKDQSIEAKNYQDIGIMVQESLRKTSDSECNTQSDRADVGVSCKMQELVCSKDIEIDACLLREQKGVNTTYSYENIEHNNISSMTENIEDNNISTMT